MTAGAHGTALTLAHLPVVVSGDIDGVEITVIGEPAITPLPGFDDIVHLLPWYTDTPEQAAAALMDLLKVCGNDG